MAKEKNTFKYIVFGLLAVAAAGLAYHFFGPKEANVTENKNMLLFIDNKIIDIDLKLANRNDQTDLATRVLWLKSNAKLYDEVKSSTDKAVKQRSENLKSKIIQVQQREFTGLRQEYAESKKEVLAGEQIEIGVSGAHNEVLTLAGDAFKEKKNRNSFMDNIRPIVTDLRFSKVIYKWSGNQKDSSEYNVRAKRDTEI